MLTTWLPQECRQDKAEKRHQGLGIVTENWTPNISRSDFHTECGRKWVSSSLGNRTVAGSYRYDSWQLQFWDTFLFFESIDILIPTFKQRIFMTIAGSYILRSWQVQLVLTVEFCIEL